MRGNTVNNMKLTITASETRTWFLQPTHSKCMEKLTSAMFCSVVAEKKNLMFFFRQKSHRCLLGGGGQLKAQDVTAKLVRFNILCMVPKNI